MCTWTTEKMPLCQKAEAFLSEDFGVAQQLQDFSFAADIAGPALLAFRDTRPLLQLTAHADRTRCV